MHLNMHSIKPSATRNIMSNNEESIAHDANIYLIYHSNKIVIVFATSNYCLKFYWNPHAGCFVQFVGGNKRHVPNCTMSTPCCRITVADSVWRFINSPIIAIFSDLENPATEQMLCSLLESLLKRSSTLTTVLVPPFVGTADETLQQQYAGILFPFFLSYMSNLYCEYGTLICTLWHTDVIIFCIFQRSQPGYSAQCSICYAYHPVKWYFRIVSRYRLACWESCQDITWRCLRLLVWSI